MMNKIVFYISGGADVHFKKSKRKIPKWLYLLLVMLLLYSSSAFAQGSIFGTVANSDASTPANGEINFYGFLGDTDEEIRIETSIGAGYDAGNWFDDFQNYLTEAPGIPYDYYFYNVANGEGAVLSKLIPNNSFQQENITLGAVTWPARPTGLAGRAVSGSSVIVTWNHVAGQTYHVYRRPATSSGSFFRIDAPSGSLTNPGTADSFYVDNTVNGTDSYTYLIIAQNGSALLGPHSDPLTVNSAAIEPPNVVSIIPSSGSYVGGTSVTINGSNFDINGVAVDIGGNALTSVAVVSPYQITGITPAGTAGLVDITVTNTASGLPSSPLVSGYTYLPNAAPVLAAIGPQTVTEATNLNFGISATDSDGDPLVLYTSTLPGAAAFVDNGNGTGTFDWTPGYTESGLYQVTFYITDNIDTVSELVDITVSDAGNQSPVLAAIGPQAVVEGDNLNFAISATDPDATIPTLSATDVPTNATFTDNGDGTGVFDFNPDLTQAGTYLVTFKAFDGALVDSEVVQIDVTSTNQPPVLAAIGPQATDEQINLNFTVTATDGDSDPLVMSTSTLPGSATFTDNGDGTGTFDWTPGFTEAGSYPVTFYASDNIDIDSEIVTITVNDAGNQAPVLAAIGPQSISEGGSLTFNISATDPDATIPALFAETIPTNASFVDNGDGTGTFSFDPDYSQAGVYDVLFYASDGTLADSETVAISVTESGNQAPVMAVVNDTTIAEGDSLVIVVTATDPDGTGVILTANTTMANFKFVDSGNGIGVFSYHATYYDAGVDTIWFAAFDYQVPPAVAGQEVLVTINDVNQPPVIEPAGPFGVAVDETLTFTISASDSTDPVAGHRIFLTAVGTPANATFTDHADNTGTFSFIPDSTQTGVLSVTFIATDMGTPQLTATLPVSITVVLENRPPVLVVGSAFTVWEGASLEIPVSATDPDGGFPQLRISKAPENCSFVDYGDGTGLITFNPAYTQSGLYGIVVEAYDGIDVTKKNVLIQVYEAGNQEPEIAPITVPDLVETDTMTIAIDASDPDGTIPTLSADSLPSFATFTDNGDGTGGIFLSPGYTDAGSYNVYIMAADAEYVDTIIVVIVITDVGPQPPSLTPIGPVTGYESAGVIFTVTATDVDMVPPILTATDLPAGATFTDNGNFKGTFNWITDFYDAGNYTVKIIATDAADSELKDSITVDITVLNVNQGPQIAIIPPTYSYSIFEGDSVYIEIITLDRDSTIPIIAVDTPTYSLADNMILTDNGDGTGSLVFHPDYTQGNAVYPSQFVEYIVGIVAIDAEYDTSMGELTPIKFDVYPKNQPPTLQVKYEGSILTGDTLDFSVLEGDTLLFEVISSDPDGGVPALRAENLPANSYFQSIFIYRKTFYFYPDFTQAGIYDVRFIASDGVAEDTLVGHITVVEAGNQAPVFTTDLPDTIVTVVDFLHVDVLKAEDPEGGACTFSIDNTVPYATFVDSGNGTASFTFIPNLTQNGTSYTVNFTVTDAIGGSNFMTATYRVILTLRGDANADNQLNLMDVLFVLSYLYKDGNTPVSLDAADANYDTSINLLDAIYLLNYFYKEGPPPPQ